MAASSQAQRRPIDQLIAEPGPSQRAFHIRQAMIYALLIFCAVIVLIPVVWMISTSLKTYDQLFTGEVDFVPNPAAPENYVEVWDRLNSINPEMTFGRIIGNTLFITILAMFGEIFSASLVAYGFSRFRWKGRDTLFLVMLSTIMLPSIVQRIPAFLIWREIKLLDTYDPLTWPSLFAWGPLYVFLMRQFFLSIPTEIEEAALIDGANTAQIYWYIMLPLIRPVLLVIAVLSFQANWNNFQGPLLYISTSEKYPLALAVRFFDQSLSKEAPLWHYMMAMSTMMMAPVLAIYFLAQRQFIEGINFGAVKG